MTPRPHNTFYADICSNKANNNYTFSIHCKSFSVIWQYKIVPAHDM